ncbi:ATP-binding protein [Marinobacterium jannaschii]|uniref:ATP-binding protein n=1 Tax=Marinobacterium jannaschii TaxID=64970 RepID=UPI0004801889|nr:ATP-binding protein [Marinobacterium jannaschii]
MSRLELKRLGIKYRLLATTLIPLLLLTLTLGGYFINSRLQDAEGALLERGSTMARLLSASAEFGLLTGNQEMLHSLMRGPSKEKGVADIIFLSSDFEVVQRANPNGLELDRDVAYPYFDNQQGTFLHPVITTGVDITDSPEFALEDNSAEIIGWVAVVLSQTPTLDWKQQILLKGTLLALGCFLVTLILASAAAAQIIRPIVSITRVVEMLQNGHLNARTHIRAHGELKNLSEGINKLAHRVQESNQSMESQINLKTQRLQATLMHLERQNDSLSKARKRADNANQAKDEFLARMSHELRTPLTSVLGFARLLDQSELQSDQREYTRIIDQTSGLLLSIIDDILDFSKLESNAITLEAIDIELDSCIQQMIDLLAPSAHAKGLELITCIDPETPNALIGDPVRLRQILTNLVSNAIKFTDSGHVLIEIYPTNIQEQNTELVIAVSDTGIGIPEEQICHLFQAFSQADTSITRRFGGSGLGLVISRRLVELMQGRITLNSQPGIGTQVQIQLELPRQAEQACAVIEQKPRVLIYDAEPLIRKSLRYQLTALQLPVSEAGSLGSLAQQAIDQPLDSIIIGIPAAASDLSRLSQCIQNIQLHFKGQILILSSKTNQLTELDDCIMLRKPVSQRQLLHHLMPHYFKLPAVLEQKVSSYHAVRILVAEDNDFNRLLIRRILERAGTEVVEAATGLEALKQMDDSIDLVLMDVHMPEMDGIQATEKLRKQYPKLPIVALTANIVSSEHERLKDAGVNEVLLKPINDTALCSSIQRLTSSDSVTTPQNSHPTTRLSDYEIGKDDLAVELRKQLEGLNEGMSMRDRTRMRHHTHQLLGLAGLYELAELEASSQTLHDALKTDSLKQVWQAYWQLQRLINNEQY